MALFVTACVILLLLTTRGGESRAPAPSFAAPIGTLDDSTVPNGWAPLVRSAARTAGIPAPVLAAQLEAESKWDPGAVSHAGAQGLAQFTPDAWDSHGRGDPFDPADAIAAQGRLLADLMRRAKASGIEGDRVALALAGYNAGFGNVERYRGIPPFDETRNYVDKIARRMHHYAEPLPKPGATRR